MANMAAGSRWEASQELFDGEDIDAANDRLAILAIAADAARAEFLLGIADSIEH
jgi:hypothetical protein